MGSEEIYYEVARHKLDAQLQSIDTLDNKVATAFAFASGVLTFFGAMLAVTSLGSEHIFARPAGLPLSQRTILILAFLLAVGLYGRIVYLLQQAYRVHGGWNSGPMLDHLEDQCKLHDKVYMQIWMARKCRESYDGNVEPLTRKANKLQGALDLILVQAILVAMTGLVALLAK